MRGSNLVILFLSLICVSCASLSRSQRLKDVDEPLASIQKAVIDSLPFGRRDQSSGGREFFSGYFIPAGKRIRKAEGGKYRYYVHVYILGDRRPYTIEVVVPKEKRASGNQTFGQEYSQFGTDERIAKVILKRIQRRLSKRPEDLNIIDDFRVF